ncbi:MAG: hypothetical protein Fur0018_12420 [Anaerolineales bacterium]
MVHKQLLYQLQQLDDEIGRVTARLDEIARLLANDEVVRKAKARAIKAKQRVEQAEKQSSDIGEETRAQRIKLEQNQAALYGGKVTHPKELQDLQREAEAIRRRIASLEEDQIQAMQTAEDVTRHYKKQLLAYRKTQALQNEQQANLEKERQRLETRREELQFRRQAEIAGLPDDERHLYEDLQTTRHGVAVASIQDGACSACGATLSTRLIQDARSPSRLARCNGCQRILYEPS